MLKVLSRVHSYFNALNNMSVRTNNKNKEGKSTVRAQPRSLRRNKRHYSTRDIVPSTTECENTGSNPVFLRFNVKCTGFCTSINIFFVKWKYASIRVGKKINTYKQKFNTYSFFLIFFLLSIFF